MWYRTRNAVPTATPATRSDRALATATARRLTATAVLQAAKMRRLLHLLLTALLVVAYCTLVLRQADTPVVFATTAAATSAVLPEWRTARRPLVVPERHMEGWFGRLVQEVWSIRRCGDGVCDAPWEFAAFGPHGCRADCGVVPAAALRTVTVTLQVRFDRESFPACRSVRRYTHLHGHPPTTANSRGGERRVVRCAVFRRTSRARGWAPPPHSRWAVARHGTYAWRTRSAPPSDCPSCAGTTPTGHCGLRRRLTRFALTYRRGTGSCVWWVIPSAW